MRDSRPIAAHRHPYANCDCHGDLYCSADRNGDAYGQRHTHSICHGHIDAISDTNTNGNADRQPNAGSVSDPVCANRARRP